MSDIAPTVFVRQDLVAERPAPVKTTGFVGFLRTRLFNSPTNILITIVCALLLWFVLVPVDQIPAGRCGLERQGPHRLPCGKRRACGRRLLAVHSGQVQPVHLRLLSRGGALAGQSDLPPRRCLAAAAADSAPAGQGHQCWTVLHRVAGRCLLPAAWRRIAADSALAGRPAFCRASTTVSATADGSWWRRERPPR